ncbi:hypothetical protein [Nannocystis pusilla]|uniref:hypothetical protein n=1 Tax=Nannocystis pusilla TaxID=889268 RepID=UPI003DA3D776
MPVYPQAKADTVFYGDTSVDDVFVDLSQFHTSLNDQGTYANSTDDRFAITSPRNLAIRVQLATGDSGTLLYYGNVGATQYTYRILMTGGTIRFHHNSSGTALASIAPPSLGLSERSYLIHWSTCRDYVGGTYLSEMAVCDLTSGTWSISRATHSQPTVDLSHSFSVAALPAGSSAFTGQLADVEKVHVGRRWHSTQEAREDYYATSSAPTTEGLYIEPDHSPHLADPYTAANAEDVGEAIANNYAFAGPSLFLAAQQGFKNRIRLYSPLVNQSSVSPVTLDRFYSSEQRYIDAPPGIGYRLSIYHFWRRPFPRGCTSAQVRVFCQTWLDAGSPGGSVVSINLLAYSMTKLPHEAGLDWGASTGATLSTNHGASGTGAWYDLGRVPILTIKGTIDLTYLAIGVKFNNVTGADYNRLKIKQVVIEPLGTTGF